MSEVTHQMDDLLNKQQQLTQEVKQDEKTIIR